MCQRLFFNFFISFFFVHFIEILIFLPGIVFHPSSPHLSKSSSFQEGLVSGSRRRSRNVGPFTCKTSFFSSSFKTRGDIVSDIDGASMTALLKSFTTMRVVDDLWRLFPRVNEVSGG